eukprot:291984_1
MSQTAIELEALVAADDLSFSEMKKQVEQTLWELHDGGEDVQVFLMELIREYGGDPNNPPPQYRHLVFKTEKETSESESIARMPISQTPQHINKMKKKKQSIITMVGNYNKQRQAKMDILKGKLREINEK